VVNRATPTGASAGGAARVGAVTTPFTQDEIKRYSRHLIMPEVGMEGQRRLKNASVLAIGAGGLGSPLAMYLTAAGVGQSSSRTCSGRSSTRRRTSAGRSSSQPATGCTR
jgi:hypothetical protein